MQRNAGRPVSRPVWKRRRHARRSSLLISPSGKPASVVRLVGPETAAGSCSARARRFVYIYIYTADMNTQPYAAIEVPSNSCPCRDDRCMACTTTLSGVKSLVTMRLSCALSLSPSLLSCTSIRICIPQACQPLQHLQEAGVARRRRRRPGQCGPRRLQQALLHFSRTLCRLSACGEDDRSPGRHRQLLR